MVLDQIQTPKVGKSLSKGMKSESNINFKEIGNRIPTVTEELVKNLGRWFDKCLKDFNQTKKHQDYKNVSIRSIAVHSKKNLKFAAYV